jgi:hypothetical protein
MIIVVRKSDYSSKPFSTLRGAYKEFGSEFEYSRGTLEKEKFPIVLKDFVINKEELVKTKYSKTNFS